VASAQESAAEEIATGVMTRRALRQEARRARDFYSASQGILPGLEEDAVGTGLGLGAGCLEDATVLANDTVLANNAESWDGMYGAATIGPTKPERPGWRVALRPKTALTAGVAVLLLGVGVALTSGFRSPEDAGSALGALTPVVQETSSVAPEVEEPDSSGEEHHAGGADTGDGIVAHVVGHVHTPGIVLLDSGARVADAVEGAGGVTDQADVSAVNLARYVVDGEQIRVPAPGEEVEPPPAHVSSASADSSGNAGDGPSLVNVNTADAAALQVLPGIGPAMSDRIVQYREKHGGFTSVEELRQVSGIGQARLESLRDLVTTG
jgi:competence protein ComEA